MTGKAYQARILRTPDDHRQMFLAQLHALCGDIRFLWLPKPTDATTSVDESSRGAVLTHSATLQGRLAQLGLAYAPSFNGGQYGSAPDVASYTFGTGVADSAFSLVAVANVTDTAAGRVLMAKNDSVQQEWDWSVNSADKLALNLFDMGHSAANPVTVTASALTTQGAWATYGSVYNPAVGSGATAAAGISHYVNGVLQAVTATNAGAYVAMVNGTAALEIGASFSHTGGLYVGSLALLMLVGAALTASQMWGIRKAIQSYMRV